MDGVAKLRPAFDREFGTITAASSSFLTDGASAVMLMSREYASQKGYEARYRQEPEWRLPFLIKPFLRGSLRYPFEGPGSSASYAVRESTDGPTELVREFRFRVRESWIVRWMGGRSNEAMSDFRKGAEVEADRYSQECLYALRDDVAALLDDTP